MARNLAAGARAGRRPRGESGGGGRLKTLPRPGRAIAVADTQLVPTAIAHLATFGAAPISSLPERLFGSTGPTFGSQLRSTLRRPRRVPLAKPLRAYLAGHRLRASGDAKSLVFGRTAKGPRASREPGRVKGVRSKSTSCQRSACSSPQRRP